MNYLLCIAALSVIFLISDVQGCARPCDDPTDCPEDWECCKDETCGKICRPNGLYPPKVCRRQCKNNQNCPEGYECCKGECKIIQTNKGCPPLKGKRSLSSLLRAGDASPYKCCSDKDCGNYKWCCRTSVGPGTYCYNPYSSYYKR